MDTETLVTLVIIGLGILSYVADAAKKKRQTQYRQQQPTSEAPKKPAERQKTLEDVLSEYMGLPPRQERTEEPSSGDEGWESPPTHEEQPSPTYEEAPPKPVWMNRGGTGEAPGRLQVEMELPVEKPIEKTIWSEPLIAPSTPSTIESHQRPQQGSSPQVIEMRPAEELLALVSNINNPHRFVDGWLFKEIIGPPIALREISRPPVPLYRTPL